MNVAIIGAGFAGLSAATVLREFGYGVTVFERAPDVGGVWSATRRYPGLETQNTKDTYALSDFPLPKHYPEWPKGEQVQAYLASYVEHFALGDAIRLGCEVVPAEPTDDGWDLGAVDGATGATGTARADYLVVANGIFCYPFIPEFPGRDGYEAAGGRVCHTSEFHDLEDPRGKHIVVVGYGKCACDPAAAIADVSASTTVVARQLIWKMPKRPGGINIKYVLLTRMGEGLFRYIRPTGFERFLHGPGDPVRRGMLQSMQTLVARQLRLKRLGLVPPGPFENIARSTVSLATDGVYRKVEHGSIVVLRDTTIDRLRLDGARPSAALSDSSTLPADVVVCGTGWLQRVPFPQRRASAQADRRARQLRAVPPDPAARGPAAVVLRLQLVVFQPAQRRAGCALDHRLPRRGHRARPGRAAAGRDPGAPAVDGAAHRRPSRPRDQRDPVLEAQHRRDARGYRDQCRHRRASASVALPIDPLAYRQLFAPLRGAIRRSRGF